MAKDDQRFTKLTAELISVAKGFVDYGADKGLLTPDGLKLTISKRQEVVRKLASEGASQRQIARTLGASKSQIDRDLKPPRKGAKNAPKRGANTNGKQQGAFEPNEEETIELTEKESDHNLEAGFFIAADEALCLAKSSIVQAVIARGLINKELIKSASKVVDEWTRLVQQMEENSK